MQKIQGGYLSPLSIQFNSGTYWRGWGGMIKYNSLGDTIFTRTYTDTSTHFDAIVACAVLNNNDYILGGSHDYNTPSYYPAYLIRTDSMGDTIWTHTYQKFSDQESRIINIIPLADGRIVVGAMTTELINLGPPDYYSYYYNRPWFLTLDSAGNILKDTLYNERYMVAGGYNTSCGSLYKDRNGGYIDIGTYDSLYTTDPSDFINFPGYIAHLDTNFRITWITSFPYMESGHRQPVAMKQLKDISYVIIGDNWDYYGCGAWSWAAKIKVDGEIAWNRIYYSDTNHCAYIRDFVERPDCGLIYTGTSMNDSLPTWHTTQDLWLVGVDSNGCDEVSCGVVADTATQVGSVKIRSSLFSVFPNPAAGNITVQSSSPGKFVLFTLLGQQVQSYSVLNGQTDLQLPNSLAAGIYLCKFTPDEGGITTQVRLVYQP
jgi:hypothetical protein